MDVPAIIAVVGGVAFIVGLFGGGLEVKEIRFPKIPGWLRVTSIVVGLVFIGIAVWLQKLGPLRLLGSTPEPLVEVYAPTATSTRAAPTDTPKSALSTATPAHLSFQDFEEDNGTPFGEYCWDAWFVTCTLSQSQVHEGKWAVEVDAHGKAASPSDSTGGTVGINPSSSDPVDLTFATKITVWVYDTQGNNDVGLRLCDDRGCSNDIWSDNASQNEWCKLTWDLSGVSGVDRSRITHIELYEWHDGVYYFDAVEWE